MCNSNYKKTTFFVNDGWKSAYLKLEKTQDSVISDNIVVSPEIKLYSVKNKAVYILNVDYNTKIFTPLFHLEKNYLLKHADLTEKKLHDFCAQKKIDINFFNAHKR